MSDHGRFIWYELITPDMAGAKRFYGDLLGWTAQDMPPMPDSEPYALLSASGVPVAGMMNLGAPMKAQGMPPNWTGYVCVDDCDAAAAKATALGGAVRNPPMDIPGIGRFAIVADPAGAVFAIMTPVPPETRGPSCRRTRWGARAGTSSMAERPRRAWRSMAPCSAGRRPRPSTWARWGLTSCSPTRTARSAG